MNIFNERGRPLRRSQRERSEDFVRESPSQYPPRKSRRVRSSSPQRSPDQSARFESIEDDFRNVRNYEEEYGTYRRSERIMSG